MKLVKPERGSDYVRRLVAEGEGYLYTSQLAVLETASVFKREWLQELKATSGPHERRVAFERYEKRLGNFYFLHLRGLIVLPSAFDNRGAVWNALREIREKRKPVDAIDLLHVYQLLTDDFPTPSATTRPVLVTSDGDLKAYCAAEGIDVLDPEDLEQPP